MTLGRPVSIDPNREHKECSCCRNYRKRADFNKNKKMVDGMVAICRSCASIIGSFKNMNLRVGTMERKIDDEKWKLIKVQERPYSDLVMQMQTKPHIQAIQKLELIRDSSSYYKAAKKYIYLNHENQIPESEYNGL